MASAVVSVAELIANKIGGAIHYIVMSVTEISVVSLIGQYIKGFLRSFVELMCRLPISKILLDRTKTFTIKDLLKNFVLKGEKKDFTLKEKIK